MTAIVKQFLSIDNFKLAWQKVADNRGGAGVDEQTITDFSHNLNANLIQLKDALANSTYSHSPYKYIRIPKAQGKWRELKIPTVRDRIVQQALLNVLYPPVESRFSPASFAYRPNISYLSAVEKVAHWRDQGYTWVLDADIVQFFDNIDRQILLAKIREYVDSPGFLWLIKSCLSAGVVTEFGLVSLPKGIPQGAVISPLLANLYLNDFDHIICNSDLQLVRYADDFLVLATNKTRIIQAYSEVTRLLKPIGLSLHGHKTRITNFQKGFRFLGHGFLEQAIFPVNKPQNKSPNPTNSKKKLLTLPRKKRQKKQHWQP